MLSQRGRMYKRQMMCRRDIDSFNGSFLAIYESLIPPEEEKLKQKQLLGVLENLVSKEWPTSKLYLYGSCANSFGVSKSDIDVCLAIKEAEDKSKIIMKLADILQSDNLQNVQVRKLLCSLYIAIIHFGALYSFCSYINKYSVTILLMQELLV